MFAQELPLLGGHLRCRGQHPQTGICLLQQLRELRLGQLSLLLLVTLRKVLFQLVTKHLQLRVVLQLCLDDILQLSQRDDAILVGVRLHKQLLDLRQQAGMLDRCAVPDGIDVLGTLHSQLRICGDSTAVALHLWPQRLHEFLHHRPHTDASSPYHHGTRLIPHFLGVAVLELHRVRVHSLDGHTRQEIDIFALELLFCVLGDALIECAEHVVLDLDERDLNILLALPWKCLVRVLLDQVSHFCRKLHASGAAADHDKVQQPLALLLRQVRHCGALESVGDGRADAPGVG
mmetsp:Transcript_28154/g.72353  ORF Transcript_28154/g.72353 Transcript_28154/m.72353 type:complete len:290 (+) Transcript_28154:392-1261(+)